MEYLIPRAADPTNTNNAAVARTSSQSAGQFAASLVTGLATFGAQVLIFMLIKDRLARIYQPRTYLVPPRERTVPPDVGWFKWIKAVLSTSNSEFVQKCGLDAYFFLRYLRTLLKIFVPATFIIVPVLIPLNAKGGRGSEWALEGGTGAQNVTGLNQLAWGNVRPANYQRYWVHWLMALFLVVYICYVAFDELRNYIRMRQAYITSPQHRLRASATTVLVSSIPPKWCTVEALDGLYDVFPGGIRNIWVNRNFDELSERVERRDKIALQLESAETELIKKCYKKNEENMKKSEKEAGKKTTKQERKTETAVKDEKGRQQAEGQGTTSGDPHQIKHTIRETLGGDASAPATEQEEEAPPQLPPRRNIIPLPVIGEGIQAVTDGFVKFGDRFRGQVRTAGRGVNGVIDNTNGFVPHNETAAGHTQTTVPPGHHGIMGATYSNEAAPQREQSEFDLASPKSPLDVDANMHGHQTLHAPENDRRPLNATSPISPSSSHHDKKPEVEKPKPEPTTWQKLLKKIGLGGEEKEELDYPDVFKDDLEEDGENAVWRTYLTDKDRDTHRLPIFGWQWMISLPLVGEKVDTIYWCRRELARLNTEIEFAQANPDRFPLMNSAFIQFNHQIAAHMACQSLSHHLPKQMAPRLIEIDPNDVIWDNMSIPWWQNYVRTAMVVSVVIGMIILWAIPVAFTATLSQLSTIANQYRWLHWILILPAWFRSLLQGVLPIAILGLLLFLLPLILRYLCKLQGTKSGMLIELSVQKYYFFFIFIQLFLVVTIGSSVSQLVGDLTRVEGIANIPNLLGQTIPTASNYFFSYILLQGLSVSAGALLQVGSLVVWFILAPLLDSTARSKFQRQTGLQNIQWGTFFPVYTNLACIGIIYSVVSPLILIFNVIAFSLFWFVYRYNTLYVTRFTLDTGGLLFPNAINCTFVGVYVMELALVGLFFLVRDPENNVACEGQAIGMIVILILTAIYQILLNNAFSPLFRYLPITLEDDAVHRDEEFARAMRLKHGHHSQQHEKLIENERDDEDIEDQLEENERRSLDDDHKRQEYEMQKMDSHQSHHRTPTNDSESTPYTIQNPEITMNLDSESKGYQITRNIAKKTADTLAVPTRGFSKRHRGGGWADRNNERNRRSRQFGKQFNQADSDRELSASRERSQEPETDGAEGNPHSGTRRILSQRHRMRELADPRNALNKVNDFNPLTGAREDIEAQRKARAELSDALYAGVNDELEDLTPEQRDALTQRAFQHSALRARRPVVWIPRDELGVSDNEVHNIGEFSKGNIWVSNIRQGLDSKGRCVYSGAPPDFSEVDLIQL